MCVLTPVAHGGWHEHHHAQADLALSHDIQSGLRLQLPVTIGQLVSKGEAIDAFTPRVFDAYDVLQRKPASLPSITEPSARPRWVKRQRPVAAVECWGARPDTVEQTVSEALR